MTSRQAALRIAGVVAVVALTAAVIGGTVLLGRPSASGRDPSGSASQPASQTVYVDASGDTATAATSSPSLGSTPSPTTSPAASPTTSPTHSAAPSPALPSLLGAIGDSYSQGYNVSPQHRYDNPGFSWVVGSAAGDVVHSLRERFQAAGASLTVVDAATSGRKMSDATRQASIVVAAARKLGAGRRAFVTFELGTNDLCDDARTSPSDFEAQLTSAVSVLRAGLPVGSEILIMPLPDFDHFRAITQADPGALAALSLDVNSRNCAPFLGSNGTLSLDQAEAAMAEYDAILLKACDAIQSTDGASGRLSCRTDQTLLSERDFKIGDLSTVDYFHPSLSGQARIAAAAWSATNWGSVPLPAGG